MACSMAFALSLYNLSTSLLLSLSHFFCLHTPARATTLTLSLSLILHFFLSSLTCTSSPFSILFAFLLFAFSLHLITSHAASAFLGVAGMQAWQLCALAARRACFTRAGFAWKQFVKHSVTHQSFSSRHVEGDLTSGDIKHGRHWWQVSLALPSSSYPMFLTGV